MPPKRDAVAEASKTFPADLKRGDLMFAKIFGFPWWPSVVRGCRQAYDAEAPVVRVRFCHTNDNATLPPSGLERFADHPEWANVTAFKFKSPNIRKKWEAALAEAQAYSAAAEESWSDDEEAKLEEMHKKQEESWLDEGHEWLGKRVARPFGKTKVFLGKITKWIPPDPEAGDGPLFHVVHDDGDEEDLEDFEVLAAFKCYANQPEAKKAAAQEAKATRQAAKAALAGLQGPRTALLFFKLDCEASIGEAADPEMQLEEVSELVQEAFDELPEGERAWYEQRAARDAKRYEREKKRKRNEAKSADETAGAPAAAAAAGDGSGGDGGDGGDGGAREGGGADEVAAGSDEGGADENRDTQQEGGGAPAAATCGGNALQGANPVPMATD